MISINETLQYIKRQLGYPFVSIELSDEQIVEVIKNEGILTFETKVPDLGSRILKKGSKKFRIKKNLYWIIDPLDREVFWIQSIIPEEAEMLANGMPYTTPIVAYDNIPDIVMRTAQGHTVYRWGKGLYWWQIDGKPQVYIFSDDGISSQYHISYTRSHSPDLSTINREYAKHFMDICLANCMIILGQIRDKYGNGNVKTPIGDIPIGGSEMYTRGNDLLTKTLEDLGKIAPIFFQMDVAFG